MRKNALKIVAAGAVLLLILGHWAWWYRPRARAEAPQPESSVAALLTEEGFRLAMWMPYPHQNLAHLRDRAGLSGEAFLALARLVELRVPQLPSFGPLAVPPASELAFAIAEDGERLAVRTRVFPVFASFARLSGRLANNPWLAGGTIYRDGQQFEVAWEGNVWSVTSEGLGEKTAASETVVTSAPALAHVRLRRAADPVPPGTYRLQRDGAVLEVVSEPSLGEARGFASLGLPELSAFLFAFTSGEAEEKAPQALVFFDQEESRALELPRIAMVHAQDGKRWKLPGESLLELTGQKPKRVEVAGGWEVTALDQGSAEAGEELALRWGSLLAPLEAQGEHELRYALWLDLEASVAEVSRLAYMLSQVPLVPPRQLERWRDIETVLAAIADRFAYLTLEIHGGSAVEDGLRLRMEPRS